MSRYIKPERLQFGEAARFFRACQPGDTRCYFIGSLPNEPAFSPQRKLAIRLLKMSKLEGCSGHLFLYQKRGPHGFEYWFRVLRKPTLDEITAAIY
jgi:hypothetical protein